MRRRPIPAEDLPYGPGNPDYEFDGDRQRELDGAAEQASHHEDLLRQQEEEQAS